MSTYILIYLTMLKIILKIRMSTLHKSSNLVNNHYVSQQSSRSITSSQKDSIFWKGLLGLNGTPPHCDLCISLQGSNNNILVCLTRNVVGLVNCKGSQTQWPRNFFDLERVICSPQKLIWLKECCMQQELITLHSILGKCIIKVLEIWPKNSYFLLARKFKKKKNWLASLAIFI